jgi:cardiolipin synthase (CMP-forming)
MVVNLPNLLTIGRILLVPLIVACFYLEGAWPRWLACVMFIVAAATDYLDGWLARNWQLQSAFGRWLDPVADKILVGAVVIMLVGFARAPLLPAVVILLREIMVSGLREYMAEVRLGLPVTRLAKWKTAVQMVAIGFLIVGDAGPASLPVAEIGWSGLWAAALLTLVTGWSYLQAGLQHMIETDAAAAARVPQTERAPAIR